MADKIRLFAKDLLFLSFYEKPTFGKISTCLKADDVLSFRDDITWLSQFNLLVYMLWPNKPIYNTVTYRLSSHKISANFTFKFFKNLMQVV